MWFDREKLKEGGDWEHYIDEGLNWAGSDKQTGRVVFIMTPHSVRRPDGYCLNEIAKALTSKIPVVPVMLVFSEPPLSIYRVQYLDMQDCYPPENKPAVSEQRLDRLLVALESNKIEFDGVQRKLQDALKPIKFERDISGLLRDFTGRKWVFEAVDNWLRDDKGSKIFWLQGAPGVGKSAISAWLRDNRREIAAFHFCDVNSEEKRDPCKMVASLVYQLSTQLPDYQDRLSLLDVHGTMVEYTEAYTLFDKLVVQPLAENFPEPDRTIIVLIDALDEATRGYKNEITLLLTRRASKTPSWLRFLVTSRPEPEITTLFQSLSPLVLDTSIEANRADISEFLRKRLPTITEGQTEIILDQSEGVFLYARYVCDEIHKGQLDLNHPDEFPRGLGEVYTQFFMRQFGNTIQAYKDRIRQLLSLIFAALSPLELRFLADVQGYNSRMELFDQLDTLGSLFPRSGDSNTDTIVPFHKSLNDWLASKDRSGPFYIDIEYGHRLLADHGWQQFIISPKVMMEYHLRYLPRHLRLVSDVERICNLLEN